MSWWKELGKKLYEWCEKSTSKTNALVVIGSVPPSHAILASTVDYLYESHDAPQSTRKSKKLKQQGASKEKRKIENYSGRILGIGSPVSIALFTLNPLLGTAAVGVMGLSACLTQYIHHKTSHHEEDPTLLELAVYRNCLEKGLDPSKYIKRYNKSKHLRNVLYKVARKRGWV